MSEPSKRPAAQVHHLFDRPASGRCLVAGALSGVFGADFESALHRRLSDGTDVTLSNTAGPAAGLPATRNGGAHA